MSAANTVTGSGVSGQVAFWNGAQSITGDNGLFWDNTNKRLGVGTTTPNVSVHAVGNTQQTIAGETASNTAAQAPRLALLRALGTEASPLAVTAGTILGQVLFNGYDGGTPGPPISYPSSSCSIQSIADETFASGTKYGGHIRFFTTAIGTVGSAERCRIADDGSLLVGTTIKVAGSRVVVVSGSVRTDTQLISTVATGTPPLAVTSTDAVANLHASNTDAIQETSGPTKLAIAGIADTKFLKRSGTTVIGSTPVLGTDTSGNYVASIGCGTGVAGCVPASPGATPTLTSTNRLLDGAAHTDTVAATPLVGQMIAANGANNWGPVAANTTTTRKFLRETGDGTNGAVPVWDTITTTDLPVAAVHAFGTNGDLAPGFAGTTMFASLAGEDDREAAVQMPINLTTRVWNNVMCVASGVPGTGNIVVQGRQGPCGALVNSGTACGITAATTTCGPINSPLSAASPGNCIDWSISNAAGANVVQVVCTVEQTG